MEQTVLKKMTRFVELSSKFSKNESDLFTRGDSSRAQNFESGGIYVSGSGSYGTSNWVPANSFSVNGGFLLNGKEIYVDKNGDVKARDNKPLTRGEQIEAEAKALSIVSDEFDEYNKLRAELSLYFSALNKINETE